MKKHLYTLLLSITILIFARSVFAQDVLVDFTYLGSRTKAELFLIFFQNVEYDIDLYKLRYQTLDVNGQLDTASGLLVLPQVPAEDSLPIVVYDHGTTSGPTDVPSQLRGGYEVAMAYGASGFATLAPDYLGMGDARGFHPYLHAATEVSASFDMLLAGYEYMEYIGPEHNYHLFLAGYSQGGHASMALHKYIDDFWSIIIPVTAATHMSGPYSISGVMRDIVLSDQPYGYPAYIAYIFLGYDTAYDLYDDVGQVFKEPYATDIDSFYNRQINLTRLNAKLLASLSAGGSTIPKRMLHDSIVDVLTNDLSHPLNVALIENDTYNWGPESPTRLYYCGADSQVPPLNAIIADSVMNALGATDTEALNLNPNFDHGPCVFLAVRNSVDFFKSFINTTSIKDLDPNAEEIKVYPNPVVNDLVIDWEPAMNGLDYEIFNTKGETVMKGHASTNKISVKELQAGLYMIICSVGNESRMARILRQ